MRFRVVIELSFPDADPWNPADFDQLIPQIKAALEGSSSLHCSDVRIRHIGNPDVEEEYAAWKAGRAGIGSITGPKYPVPAVESEDLARVWDLSNKARAGESPGISVAQACRPGADVRAVMARTLLLRLIRDRKGSELADRVIPQAAVCPMERPKDHVELFMDWLEASGGL